MTIKKDMVIGCITKYDWKQIEPWVVSLDRTGFKGIKAMVILEGKKELGKILSDRGYHVIVFNTNATTGDFEYTGKQYSIVINRFLHIWEVITKFQEAGVELEYVVSTDVKDVVFQSNPAYWLDENMESRYGLLVGCESLNYEDEEWGKNNMISSYPMFSQYMMKKPIYNAGTIAGRADELRDFAANVYMASMGVGWNPDQAALNTLLTLEPYKNITQFTAQEDGWACQLGTTADPRKMDAFRPKLLGPEPMYADGVWTNQKGEPFVLAHQWDRTPYAEEIRIKYHDAN